MLCLSQFPLNRLNSRIRDIAKFISTIIFGRFVRSKTEKVATKCRKITKVCKQGIELRREIVRERWSEFPCGSKILVFIRLVLVLVTFDKNACYAFQARPTSDRKGA